MLFFRTAILLRTVQNQQITLRNFFPFFKPHFFFVIIGSFPFIQTAAPLQLHKVLPSDLYFGLHLWSDLWLLFCTCHLKLADIHKASVIVCLPELSLDYT